MGSRATCGGTPTTFRAAKKIKFIQVLLLGSGVHSCGVRKCSLCMVQVQARRNTEFWRGKISKGAHLSEVLGEGERRSSGGRVWEGRFQKLEYL